MASVREARGVDDATVAMPARVIMQGTESDKALALLSFVIVYETDG